MKPSLRNFHPAAPLRSFKDWLRHADPARYYSGDELPLRSELYSADQMKEYGKTLAASHSLSPKRASNPLLTRLGENEKLLVSVHGLLTEAAEADRRVAPAGEWLLDNFYLIEEQIRLARRHLPKSYSRELPRLMNGPSSGLPRVYDIALETISHGDGRLDMAGLGSFVASYQTVTTLNLGELWAIPTMLRLALIENLRRVGTRMAAGRIDRNRADYWADRIIEIAETDPKSLIIAVADMTRSGPALSSPFVAEFARRLQGKGSALALPLTWIEQRLSETGLTINKLVQSENQQQATSQASISNSIGSLRLLESTDWQDFVESMSMVETVLRRDPVQIYATMDFATRDRYRHVIERVAHRAHRSEEAVACMAIELAMAAPKKDIVARNAHVGFYLIDKGLPLLERATGGDPPFSVSVQRWFGRFPLVIYAGAIGFITVLLAGILLRTEYANDLSNASWVVLIGVSLLAASHFATAMVNWLATLLVPAASLPRMDFSEGIPQEFRTLVVIPTILTSPENVDELSEALEVRFLANRDESLHFALLTDFCDAASETTPDDGPLLLLAQTKIEELNQRYDRARGQTFFLLHRPRRWNGEERLWMGHERKRGKLADLNAFLRRVDSDGALAGPASAFSLVIGRTQILTQIKYVITLDTDTQLPRDSARQLIGAMAHPLNQASIDPTRRRVVEGYGILQPRVAVSLPGTNRSRYARMFGNEPGIDPYTRVVSDVYQDVFGEGSFIGKGIYDVDAFEQTLKGRLPDNLILSHDLLEGCYARAALLSDVLLYEEYPTNYRADVGRRQRWIRGDWQISQWLLSSVPCGRKRSQRNPISILSQWKILDNLRRSLVPAALTMLLLLGWTVLPTFWPCTLSVIGIIVIPTLFGASVDFIRKPEDVLWLQHLVSSATSTVNRCEQAVFSLACLPYEAAFSLAAIGRSSLRMLITRKRLLEWNPSRSHAADAPSTIAMMFRTMWIGPVIATTLTIYWIAARTAPSTATVATLALWALAPVWVWWTGQPFPSRTPKLSVAQNLFLRRLSRRTWAFFETFVGPDDHWLPPDNFQENPSPVVSHRTSPTNIGLALLANLSAYDFGYISSGRLLERTANTFRALESLERFRGHFYNWYDTETMQALLPLYVSTVDSGNLAGHLLTLRCGLTALLDQPVLAPRFFEGIRHTDDVLMEVADVEEARTLARLQVLVEAAAAESPKTWSGARLRLADLIANATETAARIHSAPGSEVDWWLRALISQCQDAQDDLMLLIPRDPGLDRIPTLRELLSVDTGGGFAVGQRIEEIDRLVAQAADFATLEYDFLFNKKNRLLVIGYNVSERRQDSSHYDLLASEARFASFVAISQGQVPQESWFALGRLLTSSGGGTVLVSWSGSMFEYLMPLLVMPTYGNTLLDETYKAAVTRQIEYGDKRGVPWGISECGYNTTDAHLNYQYRAFGVPGLGFRRGLAGDLVIAPYASALALMVYPEKACSNLQRLAVSGLAGKYGLYEAVDYTPSRLPRGRANVVVRSFMAHHQGMTFLALAYVLLGRPMQRRFESDPAFQATLLLLQERIPRTTRTYPHNADLSDAHIRPVAHEPYLRVFNTPHTPFPEVQLLSNGRYHVMITNAGGGYSRWKDIAVTRWREDSSRDNWGTFCYVRDVASSAAWSVAYQPSLQPAESYEAIFSESRVEFRRRDHGIETHTEIAVSPEDDIEVRRIRITNFSRVRRTLEVTSYAEVVLAPPAGDALHPAFSSLFVQTEVVRDRGAILCTRRPRSAGEATPWMFHLMTARGAGGGEVSYETDRMRFIGRGRTAADPQANSGPLTGSEGSVLDPIVAIRRRISLDPDETVSLDIVSGVAETRSSCMDLVDKYQDPRFPARTFDLAWTHSQVLLQQINATESDAQLYGCLAGSVIYANSSLRANPGTLLKNRRNQSGLWGYTISGDLPIVLLRIADPSHIDLVRQLVQAHAYWRLKGLAVDLVIWNEDQAGYRQPLHDQIMGLIAAGIEADPMGRPGGILVRIADQISPEDRILLETVARAIISDSDGSLEEQLRPKTFVPAARVRSERSFGARVVPPVKIETPEVGRELIFGNGFGGFTPDGQEYVITTTRDRLTPAPWVNVIANKSFGTVVSEAGSANTWSENAHEYRLTPWSNDPVSDPSGEAFYVRDEETGYFWSPTLLPCGGRGAYVTRHGFGYSVYEHTEDGIRTELSVYVAIDASVKFSSISVRNNSGRPRRLSVTGYVEWLLGDLRSKSMMHVTTEIDGGSQTVLARNPYSTEFGNRIAFFGVDADVCTLTGDRTEFLGRNGTFASPAGMTRANLSGKVGPGMDPCAAIRVPFDLAEGRERDVVFTLGAGQNAAEVASMVRRFRGAPTTRAIREEVRKYWDHTLGALQVEIPDPSVNVLLNGWLLYQTLACRFWARSGYYQPGGAFGFRDQLQDSMALIYADPRLAREHILRCASHQFGEGDVQHWWHPPSGRGVRTRCSDDYLWLPLAVSRYVSVTGDSSILDESVHFLDGRSVKAEEDSYYDLPVRSEASATLYDHCVRAIVLGLRFGAHGLPLIGSGDWNDGMNLVGQHGTGESVWLGFFLYEVLKQFAGIATVRNDTAFSARCRQESEQVRQHIEQNGWDGQWYRRAYFDDGTPLGSATNTECQIDSIAQSWSVLSGAADKVRARMAMTAVADRLVRRDVSIVQLLDPPFDHGQTDPGYIKGYVPGVRENGGQYTHAAIWSAMAFAALGDSRQAWEILAMINPVNHGATPEAIATYKVEPYVMAADVYAVAPNTGRGGWTWYTGSSGWMYRLILESLLGFRLVNDRLSFAPCFPAAWDTFKVRYRYRRTVYNISVVRAIQSQVTLDDVLQRGDFVPLSDDGLEHLVDVRCADSAVTMPEAGQMPTVTVLS